MRRGSRRSAVDLAESRSDLSRNSPIRTGRRSSPRKAVATLVSRAPVRVNGSATSTRTSTGTRAAGCARRRTVSDTLSTPTSPNENSARESLRFGAKDGTSTVSKSSARSISPKRGSLRGRCLRRCPLHRGGQFAHRHDTDISESVGVGADRYPLFRDWGSTFLVLSLGISLGRLFVSGGLRVARSVVDHWFLLGPLLEKHRSQMSIRRRSRR